MKTVRILRIFVLSLCTIICWASLSQGAPMGTAFTYQGHLYDANHVANNLYDFQFKLYDAVSDGNQLGSDVNVPNINVIDGYFTVNLDFGSDVFKGNTRWLEICVRPGDLNDHNEYIELTPRQEIKPTPYALHTLGLTVIEDNTYVGKNTGTKNTTGHGNTFLGYDAGSENTTAIYNTFIGHETGWKNTTGMNNTFLGRGAGLYNTTGGMNLYVGNESGRFNITGIYNTYVGYKSGRQGTASNYNTYLGWKAGYNNQGNSNIFIGYEAGHDVSNGNNLLFIENSKSTSPLVYGEFDTDIVCINGKLGAGTMSPERTLDVNDVMRLRPRATAPSNPSEGDMYMDSTDHKLKVYDGTVWQECWR